jgi:hypothetical protein
MVTVLFLSRFPGISRKVNYMIKTSKKYGPKAIPTPQFSPGAHIVFILFGIPFMAIGAWMMGPYFSLFEIDRSKLHVPLSIFATLGLAFFMPGIIVFMKGLTNLLRHKRIAQSKFLFQNSPWKWDCNWNPRGYKISATKSIITNILVLIFLGSFLSPFIYFSKDDLGMPIFIQVIIIVVMVIIITIVFYNIFKALKFTNVECLYKTFPFKIPGKVKVDLLGLPSSNKVRTLTLELRFLESKVASSGSGSSKSSHTIYTELHKIVSCPDGHLIQNGRLHVDMEIPENEKFTTDLTKKNLRFWELRVIADVPGVDYDFGFLIPIYK